MKDSEIFQLKIEFEELKKEIRDQNKLLRAILEKMPDRPNYTHTGWFDD